MLNLSPHNRNQIDAEGLVATQMLNKAPKKLLRNTIYALLVVSLTVLVLPWTQNIRSNGQVLTLRPEQRPQTINASDKVTPLCLFPKSRTVILIPN
jgi:hypothetical protein